ncbi:unnamed protein product [Strongylus vulgaris]|uniref:Uncharacterized protein n=1 Tax=Strongylus vulgaris TaxID=40348 RepID=A0A3P7JWB2_STRVU|nr:unnamed protein product [Strongylus vulgaris]
MEYQVDSRTLIVAVRKLKLLPYGYTSTLIFYLIGEFYHTTSTRMLENLFWYCIFTGFLSQSKGICDSALFIYLS